METDTKTLTDKHPVYHMLLKLMNTSNQAYLILNLLELDFETKLQS